MLTDKQNAKKYRFGNQGLKAERDGGGGCCPETEFPGTHKVIRLEKPI